ncbi:MAG: FMN-binding protein [Deltaproteobacteria bacterium]|nr:FMN-binding protein [Deltaproteobacteria bacterium]
MRIKTVVFMALLSAVFIGAVSTVHLLTKDTIMRNEAVFFRKALLGCTPLSFPTSIKELNNFYENKVKYHKTANPYYTVRDGKNLFYVLKVSGPGLWGEIVTLIGFKSDKKTITGINFISQSETPGLGARISESWFKKQFIGKTGPVTMVPEGTGTVAKTQFDAITGATVTSTAVKDIVNNALVKISTVIRKGSD